MYYTCSDSSGFEVVINSRSHERAARRYVKDGNWGDIKKTTWINVYVKSRKDEYPKRVKIPIHPKEPACIKGLKHRWKTPHSIVGGIESNPGVWASGGGVICTEVCMKCGCGKHTNSWDHDPETGESGLKSVEYVEEEFLDQIFK